MKYWPSEHAELVDADFARKLERERDDARRYAESYEAMLNIERQNAKELLEELNQWKNSLSILGDTPEKVWDAWRKQVIKTQKYIREMVYWRGKCKQADPTTSVEEAKDILNSYR